MKTQRQDPETAGSETRGWRWARSRATRHIPGLLILIGATILAVNLGLSVDRAEIRGWEARSIATAIAAGHGFSYPAPGGWLTDDLDASDHLQPGQYVATAWVDPVYTFTLAVLMRSLGEWYDIGAVVLNLLLFVFVVMITYRLAGALAGQTAGLIAGLLVAMTFTHLAPTWLYFMNNTMMATALILLFSYQLQRTLAHATTKNIVTLGLVLGLTVLGVPSAILFLPLAALAILVVQLPNWRAGLLSSTTVLVLALLVIAPWALRNYMAFDELVLVRTGSGQIAFIGSVAVAATLAPDLIQSETKPEWRADTAREAVSRAARPAGRRSLERQFQMQYAREVGGSAFHAMNEAQRDKWFMHETRLFIANNPKISAELAYWKTRMFVTRLGLIPALFLVAAAIAGMVALIRWRPVNLTLALAILVYSLPFTLIITYMHFERYRLPIEPIIITVAIAGLWDLARGIQARLAQTRPDPAW